MFGAAYWSRFIVTKSVKDWVKTERGTYKTPGGAYRSEAAYQAALKAEQGGGAKPKAAKKEPSAKKQKATVADTVAHIESLKGKDSSEHLNNLVERLGNHTVAELNELKSKLGVKASGKKAELSKKIAQKALEVAGKATEKPAQSQKKEDKQSLLSLPNDQFADKLHGVIDNLAGGARFGGKVFINRAYEEMAKQDPSMTLDGFKKKLIEASIDGKVVLSRADLAGHMDQDDVLSSQTNRHNSEFHFINDPNHDLVTSDSGTAHAYRSDGKQPTQYKRPPVAEKKEPEKPTAKPKAEKKEPAKPAQEPAKETELKPEHVESMIHDVYDELKREKHHLTGSVPIHEIREEVRKRYGDKAASHAVFDPLIHKMDKQRKFRLIGATSASTLTQDELRNSVPGNGEIFGHMRITPEGEKQRPKPYDGPRLDQAKPAAPVEHHYEEHGVKFKDGQFEVHDADKAEKLIAKLQEQVKAKRGAK